MLLAESKKGIDTVQRCFVESQKGAIAIDFVKIALLHFVILNGTSSNSANALLALNWQYEMFMHLIWRKRCKNLR